MFPVELFVYSMHTYTDKNKDCPSSKVVQTPYSSQMKSLSSLSHLGN